MRNCIESSLDVWLLYHRVRRALTLESRPNLSGNVVPHFFAPGDGGVTWNRTWPSGWCPRLPGLLADGEPAGSEAVDGAPTAWGIHVTQHVLEGSDDSRLSRDLMSHDAQRAARGLQKIYGLTTVKQDVLSFKTSR